MQNWLRPLKFRLSSVTRKIVTTPFKVFFGLIGIFSAYLRAAKIGHELPPGALKNLRAQEFLDRQYLLKLSRKYGQIFKATQSKRIIVCVIGLARCRRLLSVHNDNLRPESVSLTSLFPKGILRTLEGEDHRKYRQSLVRALDSSFYERVADNFAEIIKHGLNNHARRHNEQASTPQALTKSLDDIATGLLINMYFGVVFGSEEFDQLMKYYRRLGPTGFVWFIGPEQKQSFDKIRGFLRFRLASSNNELYDMV
jgi:cytochrome P450